MQILQKKRLSRQIRLIVKERLHVFALAVAFMALGLSAIPTKASAIVGGEIVDYPWAVAFAKSGGGSLQSRTYCSGVLIKARWVLTAGHCTPANGDLIVIGRSSLASGAGQVRSVDLVRYMGNSATYCDTDRKAELCDIALVRLDSPSTMQDADLADQNDVAEWGDGTAARSYGYGRTSLDSTQVSSHLRRAQTDIVQLRDNHYTLFARGETASVCYGDSGGPLMITTSGGPRIVGIVRAAPDHASESTYCQPGSTNSYVKVGYRGAATSNPFLWIQDVLN